MSKPRHRWTLHSGDFREIPPSAVEKCAYCGVLTKTVEVKDVRTAKAHGTITLSWTPTPVYSTDDKQWSYTKPVCTGKVAAPT